uniref:Fork-head domain-containing protein n=1 Tax=Syphacia muris TaxID=451379 RepID=A0A0N5AHW6_9BILA
MDFSGGKTYATLENVNFSDVKDASTDPYLQLPFPGNAMNAPPISEFPKYDSATVQYWNGPMYPIYETDNQACVAEQPKTYVVEEPAMRVCVPIQVAASSSSFTERSSLPAPSNAKTRKPKLSFPCLIGLAFRNSENKVMPVRAIYDFIEWVVFVLTLFPYFINATTGWRSSVRHNLSFSQYFFKSKKVPKKTRGYIWCVDETMEAELNLAIDDALEREKENTIESLVRPDFYIPLQMGLLRVNVTQSPQNFNHTYVTDSSVPQETNSFIAAGSGGPAAITQSSGTTPRNCAKKRSGKAKRNNKVLPSSLAITKRQ